MCNIVFRDAVEQASQRRHWQGQKKIRREGCKGKPQAEAQSVRVVRTNVHSRHRNTANINGERHQVDTAFQNKTIPRNHRKNCCLTLQSINSIWELVPLTMTE